MIAESLTASKVTAAHRAKRTHGKDSCWIVTLRFNVRVARSPDAI